MENSKIYLLFIVYTHIIFPFIEIIISSSYNDYDISLINVSMDSWFAVKGTLSLLLFFIIFYRDQQDIRTLMFFVTKHISIVLNIIIFTWMIIGCFVLYENANSELGNKAPNFMYISIFVGFVSLINIFFIPKQTLNSLKEPLIIL